jgi:hypothetical protein
MLVLTELDHCPQAVGKHLGCEFKNFSVKKGIRTEEERHQEESTAVHRTGGPGGVGRSTLGGLWEIASTQLSARRTLGRGRNLQNAG